VQIVAIRNRIDPHYPPQTVEVFRHFASLVPEGMHNEQWVAEQDGRIVGYVLVEQSWWSKTPGVFEGKIRVDPECWRQGIGGRLYDHLLRRVTELDAQKLYSGIREGDEHAERFVSQRGFTPTGRSQRMSRLDVHRATMDGYDGLEEQLERSGLQVKTVADAGPDDEESLYDLDSLSALDVPSSEPFEPAPFEIWLQDALTSPGSSSAWSWVALDGKQPVGVAFLRRQGENAAFNSYTGVHPAYRGRGVARALKKKTIEWARENGVDFIYTGNDIANQRMLSINIRLGYQPLPASVEVVKQLGTETG
jgi:GNAT superfamily N-acetyltransferase